MEGERLTIDVTVGRDFIDDRRVGHHDAALALFDLARRGEIELAAAPQGYRADVGVAGTLASDVAQAFKVERVAYLPQLSYPSNVTYLPLPLGNYVKGLSEAWDAVVTSWRSHEGAIPGSQDRWHVETHVAARQDVFLTSDRGLLAMCARLRDEHGIAIEAMTVQAYLARRE